MKKQINLSLYKSLLYCDFFLLKYSFYKKSFVSKSAIKKFYFYNTINLIESLKNFKNLINILKFFIRKQFSKILFQIENNFCLNFIKFFCKYYSITNAFFYFLPFFRDFKADVSKYIQQKNYFYCFLGSSSPLKKPLLSKIIKNDCYLISQFKLKFNNFESNVYKTKMDILDFKKIIFLIIFFNKIIRYYCKIFYNTI